MINNHNIIFLNNHAASRTTATNYFSNQEILHFVNTLHSSLDIKIIIQHFAQILEKEILCQSVKYAYQPIHTEVIIGNSKKHQIYYPLSLSETILGEIILGRDMVFKEKEIQKIHVLLKLIIGPLNNAIKFLHAMQTALHDPLTGLANRAALEAALQHEIEIAKRYHIPFSVLALDLDNFKPINDTYGHLYGDDLLKCLANQLQHCVRLTDSVFRLGGDEFIILLSKTENLGGLKLAERIHQSISKLKLTINHHIFEIAASIGVTTYTSGDSVISLLEKADTALYRAKRNGRNRVAVYTHSPSTCEFLATTV